jgi:RNA polymerase sigma-70 factor (ECF subfamily)
MPRPPAPSDAGPPPGRGTSLTLLQRARANEPGAWDRLVHLYAPLVRFWCGRAGAGAADADDLAQEVFQAAFTGLGGFRRDRPGDTFCGWLRGITRNVLAQHFRRAGRHPRAAGGSDAFAKLNELPDADTGLPDDDPPEQMRGLYRRGLDLVRAEFEARTWEMFWLVVVENRPPAAVAAQLGVSPAAVRKAKSRILRRLKEEVGDVVA